SDLLMQLLCDSSGALFMCKYLGNNMLVVIKAADIKQVVAMVPHQIDGENCIFMFEQPGLDVMSLRGFLISDEDDEDGDPTAA
ncbi:hypothetical protein F5J12DRAFT_680411, partial [Pisolithus orientalis]|uniref:uncharacterized protein n=1 Tax=Pisolithus orientalis TaxID=936130 RepID=UPI002224ED1D